MQSYKQSTSAVLSTLSRASCIIRKLATVQGRPLRYCQQVRYKRVYTSVMTIAELCFVGCIRKIVRGYRHAGTCVCAIGKQMSKRKNTIIRITINKVRGVIFYLPVSVMRFTTKIVVGVPRVRFPATFMEIYYRTRKSLDGCASHLHPFALLGSVVVLFKCFNYTHTQKPLFNFRHPKTIGKPAINRLA